MIFLGLVILVLCATSLVWCHFSCLERIEDKLDQALRKEDSPQRQFMEGRYK